MKVTLKLIALTSFALALNSCGLPGALVRTAGNTVNSVSNLASSAMSTGM
jgi:hypothetical protein